MSNTPDNYKVNEYPIKYNGNIVWLVLAIIIFFPVGILLLVLNLAVKREGVFYQLHYRGSEGWLIFWTIVFFPVAIILGALNGFDVMADSSVTK